MKHISRVALALTLLSGTVALAQPNGPSRNGPNQNDQRHSDKRGNVPDRYNQYQNNPSVRMSQPRWSRGDRLPAQYNNRQYVVNDWQQRHLRKPPRGYHWVRDENNNYFLATVTTGVILDLLLSSH